MEAENAAGFGGLDHAELGGLAARNGEGRHGDLGRVLHVEVDHAAEVHAVDVIGAEDGDQVRIGLLHQIDVLVDGVGVALIPGFVGRAHLGRNRNQELVAEQAAELPALAQVLQERLAAELREHVDRIDSGIDEIAENEIDDPVFPSKRNGRFGPFQGERRKPRALPARQHDAQDAQSHGFSYCFSGLRVWQEGEERPRNFFLDNGRG